MVRVHFSTFSSISECADILISVTAWLKCIFVPSLSNLLLASKQGGKRAFLHATLFFGVLSCYTYLCNIVENGHLHADEQQVEFLI